MVLPTIKKFAVLSAFISIFSACYYDVEDELYPVGNDCPTDSVTYNNGIKQITDTKCATAGCHVAGTGRVDLSTYAGVKSVADDGRMRQKVLIDKTMPPGNPLPSCEMDQIKAWLDNGAPEN